MSQSVKKKSFNKIRKFRILDKVFFPKKIITVEKFPLTVSGKIDRKKLEEFIN